MNFTVPITLRYANWTAPPVSALNFSTNCTITAEWARTWLAGEKGVNNAAASAYFRQALPSNLRGLPTDGQLIDWYLALRHIQWQYVQENPFNGSNASPWVNKVIVGAFEACTAEVCQALEWDGFPDILGPGVMISAYIQAILATVLGLIPLWEWVLRRRRITPSRRQQHIIEVFNATLGIFVDTCLLLSFSVSLAGIILFSRRDFDGGGTLVTLIWAISLFYFHASTFPALLDEGIHTETQRKEGKYVFLFICAILFVVVANMAYPLMESIDYMSNWESYCIPDNMRVFRMVTRNLVSATGIGLFFWLFVFGCGPVVCDKLRCSPSVGATLRRCRKMIRVYLTLTSFFLLWYMIIFITVVRQLLLDRSGFKSGDIKWTLGQFLAMGTWLPVLVEIVCLLREGLEKGLEGRVPDGWTVVRADRLALMEDYSAAAVTPAGGDDEELELLVENRRPGHGQTRSIVLQLAADAKDLQQKVSRSTTC